MADNLRKRPARTESQMVFDELHLSEDDEERIWQPEGAEGRLQRDPCRVWPNPRVETARKCHGAPMIRGNGSRPHKGR